MNKFRFSFKPVLKSQLSLIHQWLIQDHINKWLHGEGLRNTHEDLDNFFKGASWGFHWIAYDNDIAFGYLITSENRKNEITLDLFICDLEYLGKGIAVQMIQEFLISQFSHIEKVLIDPEATNLRAIHVYQKAGFKIIGEFIASWHPVLHYQMELYIKDLIVVS